ncbi:MAG: quinate 5-dehydrogenase [Anaerolineales bacterium]|nr:quinate 5-dehydrogenase [Anaerolineales bacterium]
MKHVVSISLGSSSRDKKAEFKLGNEAILIERIGCDGNEKKARALFGEMDGKVDAFGVGGVELFVRVLNKSYPLRSGLNLVKDVKQTPCTDGRGLKLTLEQNIFQMAEPHFQFPVTPRKAMMPVAADRYGMAESLDRAGFELVFCDLMFGLGIPLPVYGLARLRTLAAMLMPVVGLMPISMLYPTGQDQDRNIPKYEKWFNYGPVVAGDFQYIRRYMPRDMRGKVIITNTTTASDVELMQSRGVAYLITSTPRIDGRSFGTNVLEAALIAYSGKGRPLTDAELAALVKALDLKPAVQALNPVQVIETNS